MMSTAPRVTSLGDIREIPLSQHLTGEGLLTIAQAHEHVPFTVERCFIVKPSRKDTLRGGHSHRTLSQFLVCIGGEIDLAVDDSRSSRVYRLKELSHGVLVPPDIWCTQMYRTSDAVLLVLCDQPFSEADYIRDYDEFVRYIDAKRRAAGLS
jgi:dTDP-4-dehydrorhamnose 3,5-epimerase-like enzyme